MGATTGAPGTLSALVAATANEHTQVIATGRPFSVSLQSCRFNAEICFCASCGAREDQFVLNRASAAATYKRSAWREVAGDIWRHSGYINQLLLFEPMCFRLFGVWLDCPVEADGIEDVTLFGDGDTQTTELEDCKDSGDLETWPPHWLRGPIKIVLLSCDWSRAAHSVQPVLHSPFRPGS